MSDNELTFGWGHAMSISVMILVVGAVVASAAGTYFGWLLGVSHQKRQDHKEAFRDAALKFNASFDFAAIRTKADQIIALANDIGQKSKTAQDTVHKEFGYGPAPAGAPDGSPYSQVVGAPADSN